MFEISTASDNDYIKKVVVFGSDVFFFFFQAEDGIRDLTVTGVQTCALPICPSRDGKRRSWDWSGAVPCAAAWSKSWCSHRPLRTARWAAAAAAAFPVAEIGRASCRERV